MQRITHVLATMLAVTFLAGFMGCDADKAEKLEKGREKAKKAAEKLEKAGEKLKKAGKKAQEVAAEVALPPSQAERLGDRMAREIAAKSTVLTDGPAVDYVRQLGRGIVEAAGEAVPEGIDFDVHVLEDPSINAFAIPGGHIFVTTGLLESAESEAELVAVLGHEVAHVTERHIAERMATIYGVSALTQIALGEDSGELERMAAELLAEGYLLKHSRDDEREADAVGMRFVIDAGHSPVGFVEFFERIARQPSPPALLSTHPNPEERAASARKALKQLPTDVVERAVHRERYRKRVGTR
jgi:predicted Zn-dependent protease